MRLLLVALLSVTSPAAAATNVVQQAADKLRYENCLREASQHPAIGLALANKWTDGGPPAQHCAAVALVGLKRYPEAARKLDALGNATGMENLRPAVFDQAGNAWMLAGEIGKAVASFQGALAISSSDPDIYADLARAQAMQADWPAVEADLNAALALDGRRPDLLVLRASARHALNQITAARADIQSALALQPKNAQALVERGAIERDTGDFTHARSDFQAALALKPPAETADSAKRNLAALDVAEKAAPKKK